MLFNWLDYEGRANFNRVGSILELEVKVIWVEPVHSHETVLPSTAVSVEGNWSITTMVTNNNIILAINNILISLWFNLAVKQT